MHTVASALAIGSSTGGLVLTRTIVAVVPRFILKSVSLITGITTLSSMQFSGCVMKKIDKNREILLLAINKHGEVFKIYVKDRILNFDEINEISNIYEIIF